MDPQITQITQKRLSDVVSFYVTSLAKTQEVGVMVRFDDGGKHSFFVSRESWEDLKGKVEREFGNFQTGLTG